MIPKHPHRSEIVLESREDTSMRLQHPRAIDRSVQSDTGNSETADRLSFVKDLG
jgi:hypothetical protein